MHPYLRKFLFFFAVTGFLGSIIVNVMSCFNIDSGFGFAGSSIFHLGAIAVVIPVFMESKRQGFQSPLKKERMNLSEFYKMLFKGLPVITVVLLAMCLVYAFINFFSALGSIGHGTPEIQDGMYVLNQKGSISQITEWEYHFFCSQQVRLFSGHWIFFYALGIIGLLPRKTEQV